MKGLFRTAHDTGAVAALVLAAALALYLPTASRAVGFIDRGELAAVAATLGVAHPTGYPTLTLLGHAATRALPLPPLLALNLLAVAWTAGGVALLAVLFTALLRAVAAGPAARHSAKSPAGARSGSPRPKELAIVGGLAAMLVACSPTWWQQANGFEAYALHAALMPLTLWLFARDAISGPRRAAGPKPPAEGAVHGPALWGTALGLGLTNHMTTVLLLPAMALALVARNGARGALARSARAAPFVALGLLPYLYLPVRAAANPRFNWGDPDSWGRFVNHVTGWQYRVWMAPEGETFRQQTGYFLGRLPEEWAYAGLPLAALGAWWLWRGARVVLGFALLLILGAVLYAGCYQIRDIGSYYLGAAVGFGVLVAAGLLWLRERTGRTTAIVVGALLIVLSAVLHYRTCDESDNRLVEDLTHNQLSSLPHGALLLSSQWDYGVSASYYLQAVGGLRPDVLVLNPELLRRSWYLTELESRVPEWAARVRGEMDRFRREVAPFESGRSYDPAAIQAAYVGMIDAMIERSLPDRPVFVTGEVSVGLGARFSRVPWHLAFRLVADTAYVAQEFPRYRYRPWRPRADPHVATVGYIYAQALGARAYYEQAHGRPELALRYVDYALGFDPGYGAGALPPLPLDGAQLVRQSAAAFVLLRSWRAQAGPPTP
jgi:hypothetical protein